MPHQIPTHRSDGTPYRLFFVCGHMRSGTNWVANLLNLHPDINCVGEGPLGHLQTTLSAVSRLDYLYTYLEPHKSILEEAFHELSRRVVVSLARFKPEAAWVGDNTSRQLWPYVPGAPHFYILRDGRDVLTSWTFHQLRLNFDIGEPFRTSMAQHVRRFQEDRDYFKSHPHELLTDENWVRSTARTWRDFFLTGKFVVAQSQNGSMDVRVCSLRYEDMLRDVEAERARMYRFLALDPGLAAPLSAESKTAPGFTHDRPDWFFRSGKAGDWQTYANDDFRRWFKEEAGPSLIEAGYETNNDW